jgi:hypothetical protein
MNNTVYKPTELGNRRLVELGNCAGLVIPTIEANILQDIDECWRLYDDGYEDPPYTHDNIYWKTKSEAPNLSEKFFNGFIRSLLDAGLIEIAEA